MYQTHNEITVMLISDLGITVTCGRTEEKFGNQPFIDIDTALAPDRDIDSESRAILNVLLNNVALYDNEGEGDLALLEIKDSIARIVDYNWDSEERDFKTWSEGDGYGVSSSDHIFYHLKKVKAWLESEEVTP